MQATTATDHQADQATTQPKEGTMASTTHPTTVAELEAEVRVFAAAFPTPAVRRGVQLAEAGTIAWADLYQLSRKALAAAIADRDERAAVAR